jgi:rRNA maturation RNase YbeY
LKLQIESTAGVRLPPRTRPVLESIATRLRPAWLHVQLILADDVLLRRLNKQFRGIAGSTDVLSFRYEQEQPTGPGRQSTHAEIYISVQRARQQARERRHSLSRETVLLALHGMLHLQGHDHMTVTQARRMRAAERPHLRWLQQLWGGAPLEPLVHRELAGKGH